MSVVDMQAHSSDSSRQAALEAKVSGLQQQLESRQDTVSQLNGELATLQIHHKQVNCVADQIMPWVQLTSGHCEYWHGGVRYTHVVPDLCWQMLGLAKAYS